MTNNHIRDTMANLLRKVCHDVKVEFVSLTDDQAELGVYATGV